MWEQYPLCKLNCFWHINQTHHERVSTKVRKTSRTCCELTVVSAAPLPDESEAARLHIGLIGSLNARLPRHTPIACDGFITLGLWLSVSIRSRLSSLTSHLRYVKPKMLSLSFRVIAHLWAGTAHRPTIGNNVTPDPIFNCQVSVQVRRLFLSFNHNRLFSHNKCEMKLRYLFALSFQYDMCYNSGNLFFGGKTYVSEPWTVRFPK